MNSKILMFFDTNFIYGKKPKKIFFDSLRANDIEPFISENVVIELKGQNVRKIKAEYDSLYSATQKDMCKLYFNISLNIDLEKSYKESDKRMDKYIFDCFGDNVIKKQDDSEMMKLLIERNKFKIPPFVKQNSDKGWVDTLIWLSFINYCINNNFEKYIFVTEDKGFIDNIKDLELEFEKRCNNKKVEIKSYSSCDEILKNFDINKNQDETEEKKPPFIKEEYIVAEVEERIIERVRTIIQNVFYTSIPSSFGVWDDTNCEIKRKLSLNEAEEFCNLIVDNINELLFFAEIDLKNFFDMLNVECKSKHSVEKKDLKELADQWTEIITKYINLKNSFLQFLLSNINSMYVPSYDDGITF